MSKTVAKRFCIVSFDKTAGNILICQDIDSYTSPRSIWEHCKSRGLDVTYLDVSVKHFLSDKNLYLTPESFSYVLMYPPVHVNLVK